jgi:hypothetical protein
VQREQAQALEQVQREQAQALEQVQRVCYYNSYSFLKPLFINVIVYSL